MFSDFTRQVTHPVSKQSEKEDKCDHSKGFYEKDGNEFCYGCSKFRSECGTVPSTWEDKEKKDFAENFANPDLSDSSSQFKKEFSGRLYQEFESYLLVRIRSARKEATIGTLKNIKDACAIAEMDGREAVWDEIEQKHKECIDTVKRILKINDLGDIKHAQGWLYGFQNDSHRIASESIGRTYLKFLTELSDFKASNK